jgi:hypothetical protein
MKTVVTVRYASGREERFEMEFWMGSGSEARLQEFVEKPNLLLRTGEEVIIIPASAIECISIKVPKGDTRFEFSSARPAKRLG